MATTEQPLDEHADAQQAEKRVRLIRVKRKRAAEAPEDLVVEGLAAPGKRANTSLSGALAGLGLGAAPDQAQEGGEAEPGAQPAARRQRYRRLSTLSATQLRSIDQQQLSTLLAARQQQQGALLQEQQRQQPAARASVRAAGGGTAVAGAAAGRAARGLQAGQAARYEQIRRRRGLSNFSITEHAADPLADLASVYDVVRHDTLDAEPAGGHEPDQPPGSGAAATGFGGAGPTRPSAAQRAAAAHDEGTLLCNFMPMIREYLASQGRPLPGDGAADGSAGGAPAAAAARQQQEAGMEEDGDEYVYDLYAAVSDEEEGGGGGKAGGEEAAWELHTSGHAPVVQIIDEDNWLVLEGSDREDSDADSEDSNAEGFYAHDYPDEPSDLDSSDDGGYDPEGATFHRGGRSRPWDEQSYGYGSGDESG